MHKLYFWFSLLLGVMLPSAYVQAQGQSLQEAAGEYCNSFNVGVKAGSEDELPVVYGRVMRHYQQAVVNQDFKDAIASVESSNFSEFYHLIRKQVESLLGGAWECEHFDNFFLPTQTVIPISLNAAMQVRIDPNDPDTLVIMIAHTGDILVGNAPLKAVDQTALQHAIQSRLNGRALNRVQFVLYADEGADASLMPKLLNSLAQLGVTDIGLIDF